MEEYLVKISMFNNSCTMKAQLMSYASERKTYMYKQFENVGFQSYEKNKDGAHIVMTTTEATSQYNAIKNVLSMFFHAEVAE